MELNSLKRKHKDRHIVLYLRLIYEKANKQEIKFNAHYRLSNEMFIRSGVKSV
jgi:hypothetical protein